MQALFRISMLIYLTLCSPCLSFHSPTSMILLPRQSHGCPDHRSNVAKLQNERQQFLHLPLSKCSQSSFISQKLTNRHRLTSISSLQASKSSQTSSTTLEQQTTKPWSVLSSAYDQNLPAALVGEAVRSALRSDRGICFDFTRDRYFGNCEDGIERNSGNCQNISNARLVDVMKVQGKGTASFLNAKFSQSVPPITSTLPAGRQHDSSLAPIRMGSVFEAGYLTSKGRIIDRVLILAFENESNKSNEADEVIRKGGVEEAFIITSPGNNGGTLYKELSPLVFPMDQITLSDFSTSEKSVSSGLSAQLSTMSNESTSQGSTSIITLACSSLKNAQTSFNNNILPLLQLSHSKSIQFPSKGTCHHYNIQGADIYLMEHTFLPSEACRGYTLLIQENEQNEGIFANQIWDRLTDEYNNLGPVGVGSLEYETLRIEAGLTGYGFEMTGDGTKKSKSEETASVDNDTEEASTPYDSNNKQYQAKANPLELHLQPLIDTEKGCYQGQEGVASMVKNTKGTPRSLYQVVFYDWENSFDASTEDDDDDELNGFGGFAMERMSKEDRIKFQQFLISQDEKEGMGGNDGGGNGTPMQTRQPRPGDALYVLGSDESIQVGTITSVAQPNGTGDGKTVALALVKRPTSILESMKDMKLEMPRWWEDEDLENEVDDRYFDEDSESMNAKTSGRRSKIAREQEGSGIMRPPPLDPLHNLEVIIGGTYTVGRLFSVPSRRYGYMSNNASVRNDDVGAGYSREIASLLDYEGRGKVVESAETPGYFSYDFKEDKDVSDDNVVAFGESSPLDDKYFTASFTDSKPQPLDQLMGNEPGVVKDKKDTDVHNSGDDDDQFSEESTLLAQAKEEAAEAAAKAEAAAAEAKRKAEKMEMLKARAEAAMASRRKKRDEKQ